MKNECLISEISRTRDLLNRLIVRKLAERGIYSIGPSHGQILNSLYSNEPLSMTDISEQIGKKINTVTTLIDKLHQLNYVDKRRDTADRRKFKVRITDRGKQMRGEFYSIYNELNQIISEDVSQQSIKTLFSVLPAIYDNLTEEEL